MTWTGYETVPVCFRQRKPDCLGKTVIDSKCRRKNKNNKEAHMVRRTTLAVGLLAVVINAGFAFAGLASDRGRMDVSARVRRELAGLPYTGIWDWIEAEIRADGTVVLRGQVIQPSSKSDAEFRVRRIESVAKVVNDLHVLPLSQADNDIRLAVYRSLFNINSALVGYALGANPSIHIIVENGRVALKGVVSNAIDRQIASVKVKSVFGVFDVDNQLRLPSEI
jgi:hyperosmotically inducible protein